MQYRLGFRGVSLFIAGAMAAALAASQATGVPNFREVNEHVYRGGQPSPVGFKSLAKLGVKTVIDLRGEGERSQAEEKIVKSAGMKFISVPMSGMQTPSNEQIWKVLGVLDDSSQWPVFVHCRRGKDRTGVVLACYRIVHDHWENQKALEEARLIGMSWIERAMQNYILHFQPAGKPAPLGSQPPALSAQ
jgi:protein tyrosine/serine phosphatase